MQKIKEDRWSCKRLKENNVKYQKQMIINYGNSTCKMKQQQKHDIKGRENSERIRVPDGIWTHDPPWSSRMLKLLDWNRITLLLSQVMTGTHELTNSIAVSH